VHAQKQSLLLRVSRHQPQKTRRHAKSGKLYGAAIERRVDSPDTIDAMSNGDTSFISDRFNERPHVCPGLAVLVTDPSAL